MADLRDAPLPRPILGGRFVLTELIGQGGMATVHKARDTNLRVDRAIKIILGSGNAAQVRSRRLNQEARALDLVRHPHILRMYESGECEEGWYVVMEYVPGGTLDDLLKASGPLPARQATLWMMQVLSALQEAHAHGVIHRDVKPSNILLGDPGPDGVRPALLADFGIALMPDEEDRHTRTGVTMGSVAFMAPEQRINAKAVGPPADVYAAASTLYHLVTAATPVDLFAADEASPRWWDVPAGLRPALYAATRHDPARRPASAAAFRDELAAVIDHIHDAPHVRASSAPYPAETVVDRSAQAATLPAGPATTLAATAAPAERRWLALGAGVVATVAIGAVAIALGARSTTPPPVAVSAPLDAAPPAAPPSTPPGGAAPALAAGAPAAASVPTSPPAPARPAAPPAPAVPEPRAAKANEAVPAAPVSPPPATASMDTPPPDWAEARAVSGAPWAGRWSGKLGADLILWMLVDGAEADLRGTMWLGRPGGQVVSFPVRGTARAGQLELRSTGRMASGVYRLDLDRTTLAGTFEADRTPADGEKIREVKLSRAP